MPMVSYICLTWGLLALKLWSRAASIVPTFITSWVKCVSLGRYLRYNEWYTSRAVIYTNCTRWTMSFNRSLSFTMLNNAVWAALPGLSHFFFRCCSAVSLPCSHLWKCLLPGHSCLLVTWWMTDNHFSFNTSGSLPQLSAHHHRWLTIDGIHGARSEQHDFFDAADNFLLTDLERCQGSNWWSMVAWLTLISFLIWGCRSVDITSTLIPFSMNHDSMLQHLPVCPQILSFPCNWNLQPPTQLQLYSPQFVYSLHREACRCNTLHNGLVNRSGHPQPIQFHFPWTLNHWKPLPVVVTTGKTYFSRRL